MNNNHLKAFVCSITLTGIIFCLITFLFIVLGILSINEQASTSAQIGPLPIVVILLQFAVPCLGLGLYCFLNNRFPKNDLDKFSLSISNLILGICVAMLFFGYLKTYTLVTFLILFSLLLYIEYKGKLRFMYRFYRTYAALLIPFYLLCLLVKSQAQLKFDSNATLKLELIYLPIEAYFYLMSMLLVTVYLFEIIKSKNLNIRG